MMIYFMLSSYITVNAGGTVCTMQWKALCHWIFGRPPEADEECEETVQVLNMVNRKCLLTSRANTSLQSTTTKDFTMGDRELYICVCQGPFLRKVTKMGYKNILSYCPMTARRALTLLAMFSTEH